MKWNVNFEIAAIVVEAIFILFFYAKKHLPTRQNRHFALSMEFIWLVLVMDVLSAYINTYWVRFPIALVQFINVIYFLLSAVVTISLFMYVLSVTRQIEIVRTPIFVIYLIPFIVAVFMALSTPFTGLVYRFDEVAGYVHGPVWIYQAVWNCFYIILAGAYVGVYRRYLSRQQFFSMVFFFVIIALGVLLQIGFFNWVLLTNSMICLAVTVIYLSMQNPDLYIDKRTGLFNREGFLEMVQENLDAGNRFSLVGVYFDNYNVMQSVYGDEKASLALSDAVGFIKKFSGGYLFRLSTDYFVALDLTCRDFPVFAQQLLRERFAGTWRADTDSIRFSISLVDIPPEHVGNDMKRILDILTYSQEEVQNTGSRQLVIDEDTILKIERDAAIEKALEKAIEKRSVQIYMQPIYYPRTGRVAEAEVLARLFDDEVGFISPVEFINKAEKNGNMIELGRQIFEKICEFLGGNDIERLGIERICVNLSPMQCMRDELADELIEIAESYAVNMSKFSFEITEMTTSRNSAVIHHNMEKLIKAGAEFALDDYGMGNSNLVNLFRMPFRYVKLDKTLVWTYFENDSDVLPDVIETFRNQRVGIIVSGVETKAMAKRLIMMGCDGLQGYYFAKPVPARDFCTMIRELNVDNGYDL